eukprot:m.134406 g.134406  ORF g.134406 m.134406 type:complete len:68 (+) comp29738_c1_seq1:5226-5429(+)
MFEKTLLVFGEWTQNMQTTTSPNLLKNTQPKNTRKPQKEMENQLNPPAARLNSVKSRVSFFSTITDW